MLLNVRMKVCLHLTLTNVVFELPLRLTTQQTQVNLTLTNVVFEWRSAGFNHEGVIKFNFNKCCI